MKKLNFKLKPLQQHVSHQPLLSKRSISQYASLQTLNQAKIPQIDAYQFVRKIDRKHQNSIFMISSVNIRKAAQILKYQFSKPLQLIEESQIKTKLNKKNALARDFAAKLAITKIKQRSAINEDNSISQLIQRVIKKNQQMQQRQYGKDKKNQYKCQVGTATQRKIKTFQKVLDVNIIQKIQQLNDKDQNQLKDYREQNKQRNEQLQSPKAIINKYQNSIHLTQLQSITILPVDKIRLESQQETIVTQFGSPSAKQTSSYAVNTQYFQKQTFYLQKPQKMNQKLRKIVQRISSQVSSSLYLFLNRPRQIPSNQMIKLDSYIKNKYQPIITGIKKFELIVEQVLEQYVVRGFDCPAEEKVQHYRQMLSFVSYIAAQKDKLKDCITQTLKRMLVASGLPLAFGHLQQ